MQDRLPTTARRSGAAPPHCGVLWPAAAAMAFGAAVAFGAAPADEFKPFVFILAGDPEIGKPDITETAKRLALLAQRANAIEAALVVIPGDLTHDSSDEQLKAFVDAAGRFAMPVLTVPGNHDKAKVFAERFGPDHKVLTLNNCDFVCLNSNLTDEGSSAAKAQCKWLEEALKASRERGRTHTLVVLHNPSVADRDPLRGLLVKYGVKVVLAGHLHKTQVFKGKGYTTYVVSGTDRVRDDKGLGYRVFKVTRDRIEQEFVPLEKEVAPVDPTKPYEAALRGGSPARPADAAYTGDGLTSSRGGSQARRAEGQAAL
jgi:predicted phosphodiesterase